MSKDDGEGFIPDQEAEERLRDLKSHKIIVLDDDEELTAALTSVLSRFGQKPVETHKPSDFFDLFAKHAFDIALIDINLGSTMDGFEVIQGIRKIKGPSFPVLAMSRTEESQRIAHALECGAHDFIAKPIERRILNSKIAYYLRPLAVPKGEVKTSEEEQVELEIPVRVAGVDELGIQLTSDHLLSKGRLVACRSPLFERFGGSTRPVRLLITKNGILEQSGGYWMYGEFDTDSAEFYRGVYQWLESSTKKNKQ